MTKPPLRIIHRILFFILLVGISPFTGAFDAENLSELTQRGMDLWHVPGMSVAVVKKDEILFKKSFGVTALDQGQAVDEHTLFAIASTTKAMVVAGILILVDEGKLSLDDPISKHIPELQFDNPLLTQQLMVRDLLAHRTGLPSTDFWTFFQNMPLEEQLSRLKKVPLQAPLRTRLIYQNTMYEIAGLLIERLGGKKWQDFLTERLWLPIGMHETYGDRAQIANGQSYVKPYLYREDRLLLANWNFPAELANAAGSAWSSIHDMSLWAQFLLRDGVTVKGERLISEAGMAEMFEPQQLSSAADFQSMYPATELTKANWHSYGLAWFQLDFQGRKIDFHTGSLSGLIAIIGLDRAGDKAVVALGNRDHAEMRHAILWHVMDRAGESERRDWNQDVFDLYEARSDRDKINWQATLAERIKRTRPSMKAVAYKGHYSNPLLGDITIGGVGPYLTLQTAKIEFAILHWHFDSFLLEYEDWNVREFVTFTIDPAGRISSLKVFGETFERVPVK